AASAPRLRHPLSAEVASSYDRPSAKSSPYGKSPLSGWTRIYSPLLRSGPQAALATQSHMQEYFMPPGGTLYTRPGFENAPCGGNGGGIETTESLIDTFRFAKRSLPAPGPARVDGNPIGIAKGGVTDRFREKRRRGACCNPGSPKRPPPDGRLHEPRGFRGNPRDRPRLLLLAL